MGWDGAGESLVKKKYLACTVVAQVQSDVSNFPGICLSHSVTTYLPN